jgi:hypothetical protein
VVRFVGSSFLFNQLTISRADIPCVLENAVGGAARSTHPVTLYITVNTKPPNPYPIPTEGDNSFATEATIQGRVQFPTPEHFSPLSHHQPVETGNIVSQSCEEMSTTGTKNPPSRLALDRADEAMERIDRLNTWEGAVGKIKWLMDTLGPIAEVRA